MGQEKAPFQGHIIKSHSASPWISAQPLLEPWLNMHTTSYMSVIMYLHIYVMTWSYLIQMAIPAIQETNALREVLWQRVGKFLLKSTIALFWNWTGKYSFSINMIIKEKKYPFVGFEKRVPFVVIVPREDYFGFWVHNNFIIILYYYTESSSGKTSGGLPRRNSPGIQYPSRNNGMSRSTVWARTAQSMVLSNLIIRWLFTNRWNWCCN